MNQLKERLPEALFEKLKGSLSIAGDRLKFAEYKVWVLEERLRLVRIGKYGPGAKNFPTTNWNSWSLGSAATTVEDRLVFGPLCILVWVRRKMHFIFSEKAKAFPRRGSQPVADVARPTNRSSTNWLPRIIQAKLRIAAPNDKYEQEANRVADRIMRMPEERIGQPMQAQKTPGKIPFENIQVPGEDGSLGPGGLPLSDSARSFFEPRFGFDFSRVRIHADAEAGRLNRALNAKAFTCGSDVYFNSNNFNPDSISAKWLLAHELTHVVQQNGRRSGLIQRLPNPVDEFAPKGPLGQAREDVSNALLTASRKLDQSIKNRDNNGPLPPDVYKAYTRFFAGPVWTNWIF